MCINAEGKVTLTFDFSVAGEWEASNVSLHV